jgi:hypothetical protein
MARDIGHSLDRDLRCRDKLIIKFHLFTCRACRRYLQQVKFLKEAIQLHGEGPAGNGGRVSLRDDAKVRMKALVRSNIGAKS